MAASRRSKLDEERSTSAIGGQQGREIGIRHKNVLLLKSKIMNVVELLEAKWARLVKCRIYELAKPHHALGEPSAKHTILWLTAQKNLEEG
ncbi:hypothetical protein GmHk_15G044922 [Glycine max]|nr:hypothetical protein GmHk_15G044922 [Glycine max]